MSKKTLIAHMQCTKCGLAYDVKAAAVLEDGSAYFGSNYRWCPMCEGLPKVLSTTPKARTPTKTIVHVNQHVIRANNKTGARDPVITVKRGRLNTYAHSVRIDGPCQVVYSPDKPLNCGARVWLEVPAGVPVLLDQEAEAGST